MGKDIHHGCDLLGEKLKYSTDYALNIDQNIIYLFTELEHNLGTFLRIRFDILQLWHREVSKYELKEITLDISSPGGDLYSMNGALDFFHELKQKGILVHTRAQGICMSAATALLAAGTGERSSYPHTSFMLHDLQVDGIEGTANQVRQTAKTISNEQLEFFSYYAKFSRKNKTPWTDQELLREAKKWHKKYTKDGFDHYINATEMLSLNLIDKIL